MLRRFKRFRLCRKILPHGFVAALSGGDHIALLTQRRAAHLQSFHFFEQRSFVIDRDFSELYFQLLCLSL